MEKYGGRLKLYTKDSVYFIYSMPVINRKKPQALEELKSLIGDFSKYLER